MVSPRVCPAGPRLLHPRGRCAGGRAPRPRRARGGAAHAGGDGQGGGALLQVALRASGPVGTCACVCVPARVCVGQCVGQRSPHSSRAQASCGIAPLMPAAHAAHPAAARPQGPRHPRACCAATAAAAPPRPQGLHQPAGRGLCDLPAGGGRKAWCVVACGVAAVCGVVVVAQGATAPCRWGR